MRALLRRDARRYVRIRRWSDGQPVVASRRCLLDPEPKHGEPRAGELVQGIGAPGECHQGASAGPLTSGPSPLLQSRSVAVSFRAFAFFFAGSVGAPTAKSSTGPSRWEGVVRPQSLRRRPRPRLRHALSTPRSPDRHHRRRHLRRPARPRPFPGRARPPRPARQPHRLSRSAPGAGCLITGGCRHGVPRRPGT